MGEVLSRKRLKEIRALLQKSSERRKTGLFVAEGSRMVSEAPEEELSELILSESYAASKEGAKLADRAFVLPDEVFRKLSDTVNPQGIMAVIRQRHYLPEQLEGGNRYLVLEGIQDPGNLGTIVRTAEAAGISGIFMDRNTADIYSPKVVRSTMGSIYRVPFCYVPELSSCVAGLKKKGVAVYAAHLEGIPMGELRLSSPRAFLIGNEGSGLSDEICKLADQKIRIPMEGRVESLNAAVAAAILMYLPG